LTGDEVNPVIKTLRANGIEVAAIHSHMLDEEPRLFFLHFWANDDALKLARGLRAAIDKTASARELLSRFRHQRKMRENKVGRGVSLGVSMYAGTGCGEAAGGRVNSSGMKSQSGDMGVLVVEWDAMLRLSPHGEIALPHAPIRGRTGRTVKT
jgi:hypothetical protein